MPLSFAVRRRSPWLLALLLTAFSFAPAQQDKDTPQGMFKGSTDIGTTQPGASIFEAATSTYKVSGGGEDVWAAADDFRYTWTKVSGDLTFTGDVNLQQPSTHAKAKGMLMIRQSLDPGSPYVDVAIHGDGHIDLQWRAIQGGETKDTDLPEHGTVRVRIERRGDHFTAYAFTGEMETPNAPSVTIPLTNPVYVGIGVCSHDTHNLQTVTFSNLKLSQADHTVTAAQLR